MGVCCLVIFNDGVSVLMLKVLTFRDEIIWGVVDFFVGNWRV